MLSNSNKSSMTTDNIAFCCIVVLGHALTFNS